MEIDPFLKGDLDFAMDWCVSDIIYSIVNYVIAIANILVSMGGMCGIFTTKKQVVVLCFHPTPLDLLFAPLARALPIAVM